MGPVKRQRTLCSLFPPSSALPLPPMKNPFSLDKCVCHLKCHFDVRGAGLQEWGGKRSEKWVLVSGPGQQARCLSHGVGPSDQERPQIQAGHSGSLCPHVSHLGVWRSPLPRGTHPWLGTPRAGRGPRMFLSPPLCRLKVKDDRVSEAGSSLCFVPDRKRKAVS